MDVAQLVITSLVALVGLYLAHSYRRQQRVLVADRRLDAYGELWALLEVARPTRIKDVSVDLEGPLARDEARTLYRDMTHWYFGSGNSLLLPDATKSLYLKVKARLGDYGVEGNSASEGEGRQRIEEIGLLRAQMRLSRHLQRAVPVEPRSGKLEAQDGAPQWRGHRPYGLGNTAVADPDRATLSAATASAALSTSIAVLPPERDITFWRPSARDIVHVRFTWRGP